MLRPRKPPISQTPLAGNRQVAGQAPGPLLGTLGEGLPILILFETGFWYIAQAGLACGIFLHYPRFAGINSWALPFP
jgi:hypothetical protein